MKMVVQGELVDQEEGEEVEVVVIVLPLLVVMEELALLVVVPEVWKMIRLLQFPVVMEETVVGHQVLQIVVMTVAMEEWQHTEMLLEVEAPLTPTIQVLVVVEEQVLHLVLVVQVEREILRLVLAQLGVVVLVDHVILMTTLVLAVALVL